MTATYQRDDLSQRTALSKSALTAFEMCQSQAWFGKHYRLPLIPQERITFGSAVDAAVEQAIRYISDGKPIDNDACLALAESIIERDGTEVDIDEVDKALTRFVVEVAGHYDFRGVRLQERISGELPDLGEVDGHPDVWLADSRIFDVKTAKRVKPDEPTLELGFYALLGQAVRLEPVPSVGYWTWVRTAKPSWQRLEWPVTPELLRWTVENAASYVRATRIDDQINERKDTPENWSMTGGPKLGRSSCLTCQYSPMCPKAWREEGSDVAA